MSYGQSLDGDLLKSGHMQKELLEKQRVVDGLKQGLKGGPDKDKKLREATQGFESIFINKLWRQMRSTVPKEGYLHSKEEEFYLSMFDRELADKLSKSGGIGLGEMLYNQLKKQSDKAGLVTSPGMAEDALPISPIGPAARKGVPIKPLDAKENTALKPENDSKVRTLYPPFDQTKDKDGFNDSPEALYTDLDEGGGDGERGGDEEQTTGRPEAAPAPRIGGASPRPVLRPEPRKAAVEAAKAAEPVAEGPDRVELLARKIESGLAGKSKGADQAGSLGRVQGYGDGSRPPVMQLPVQGEVSSGFGWRKDPFTGERAWHAGIDYAAAPGTSIKACWDGKVIFSGKNGGYGKMVVLEHKGGWRSYYGHARKTSVKVGDVVKAGRKIAEVGSTGRSTGPHLHFELRQGGLAWNPEQIQERLLAGLSIGRKG